MSFNQDIKRYGLTIFESEAPDREVIDFSVYESDLDDNVAWVWGSGEIISVDNNKYDYDYEVECGHQIEWGDDDERGYCVICGKECDWHYETQVVDEGKNEYGYYCKTGEERVIDEWHEGDGGIIKRYIEQHERRKDVRK